MRIVAPLLAMALAAPALAATQPGDAQVLAALQAAEAGQPYDPASIAARDSARSRTGR